MSSLAHSLLATALNLRLGGSRWTSDGYFESVVLDPKDNRIEIPVL